MKKLIFTLIFPLFVWGQGAQLPKYTVSTLPTASLYPTYTVQVTDGLTAIDCTSGGGTFNVLCTSHGGAWNSVAQASGTTTNPLTMNNSGSGAASGATFNGSAARTISYNTIGAAGISGTPTIGNCVDWASASTIGDAGTLCGSGGGGGVQYNSDPFLVTSFSGLYADGDTQSRLIGVPSSVSCTGTNPTTCTVAFGSAHGLSVGGAIDMSNLASWPASPAGAVQQSAQFGSFQVATVPDSTHITFTTPTTLTYTCSPCTGNTYDASLWGIWRLAREPFIYGHATVYGIETSTQSAVAGLATWVAGMSPAPKFLLDQSGQNDFVAGRTVAQVEADHQSLWAIAHTAGMKVIQTTLIPAAYGVSSEGSKHAAVDLFFSQNQSPTAAMLSSGQYIDRYIDTAKKYRDQTVVVPNPAVTSIFADAVNEALSTQAGIPESALDDTYSLPSNTFVPSHTTTNYEYFLDGSSSSLTPWMAWVMNSGTQGGLNLYDQGSNVGVLHLVDANLVGPSGWWPAMQIGTAVTGTNNNFNLGFGYAGSGSTSNYFSINAYGNSLYKFYADGEFLPPGITPGTSPACFNGSLGGLTNVGCSSLSNPMTTLGDAIYGGASGTPTRLAGPTTSGHLFLYGWTPSGSAIAPTAFDFGANAATWIKATSPIVATQNANDVTISCPTCGTSTGGTNVSQNSGGTETNLAITGHMPQVCSDTSGSGTAQSCSTANTFTPQTGNCLVYQTTTANSGTGLTVNVNSLGAKSVAVASSTGWTTTLTASSSIPANKPLNICYDGTNWNASGTGYVPAGGGGAWTNITSSLTSSGCGTNTGGVCTVSGTTTTDVQFSSIPAHKNIQIKIRGQGSAGSGTQATSAYVAPIFNSDSTAGHYTASGFVQVGASAIAINGSTSSTLALCQVAQLTNTGMGQITMDMQGYADTSFFKAINYSGTNVVSNGSANWYTAGSCGWLSTSAMTQIDLNIASGHYVAGTTVEVFVQD